MAVDLGPLTNEFKPGDVVTLKSGGPRMTVSSVVTNANVLCTYFHKVGNDWGPCQTQSIAVTSLVKVEN